MKWGSDRIPRTTNQTQTKANKKSTGHSGWGLLCAVVAHLWRGSAVHRALRRVGWVKGILIAVALLLLLCLQSTSLGVGSQVTRRDYSQVLQQSVHASTPVSQIAMLGAHDALTGGMRPGKPAPDGNALAERFGSNIARGLVFRLSKTQRSTARQLAQRGVRYFDIRCVRVGEGYYAKHGLLARTLKAELQGLLRFMHESPGELLVLDFQDVNPMGRSMASFAAYVGKVRWQGRSLYDYVRYSTTTLLGALTFGEATAGGGGVLLLLNDAKPPAPYYARAPHLVSRWHNTDSPTDLLAGMQTEAKRLQSDANRTQRLRVNQAVLTPQSSAGGLLRLLAGWSVMHRAAGWNQQMLQRGNWNQWLPAMPIVMVDAADSMQGQFNDKMMAMLTAWNRDGEVQWVQ